ARSAGTGSTARARPALRGVPSGAGVQKAEGTGGFLAGSALRGLAPCPRAVRAAHPSPAAAGRVGRLRRPAGPLVAPLPRRAMLVTNARHVGRGRVVDTEHGPTRDGACPHPEKKRRLANPKHSKPPLHGQGGSSRRE